MILDNFKKYYLTHYNKTFKYKIRDFKGFDNIKRP